MVKNPPANAGDMGSIPGPGRSHMPWSSQAHAPQLLNLCSRAREPHLLKPACIKLMLPKRSHRNEKPVHPNKEQPLLAATRESPHPAAKTQLSQKYVNKLKKKKEIDNLNSSISRN